MTIPTSVRTEALHGAADQFAFLYGPVVLAGEPQRLAASLRRLPGEALAFQLTSGTPRREITLRPFNELHYQRYNVYWQTH